MTDNNNKTIKLIVTNDYNNTRLDKFLSNSIRNISRNKIQQLISEHKIEFNGSTKLKPSNIIKTGEKYLVNITQTNESELSPLEFKLDIKFEDEDIIILSKPYNMVTHPGTNNQTNTLSNILLYHCGPSISNVGHKTRPGIVHRLDKDTSGLMIAAKTQRAYLALTKSLMQHQITKKYIAIIWRTLLPLNSTIRLYITKEKFPSKKMKITEYGGKLSITHYRTLKILANNNASIVEFDLETGRTHQIRLHCSHLKRNIIGDKLYGSNKFIHSLNKNTYQYVINFHRQALHSYKLSLIHPFTGQHLDFTEKIPSDIQELCSTLEHQY